MMKSKNPPLLLLPLPLVEDCLELGPGPLLVLGLGSLLLGLHHGVGRHVGEPHRAVCGVHALVPWVNILP